MPECKSRLSAKEGGYRSDHCYLAATRATAPIDFNIPSLAATVLPKLKVIVSFEFSPCELVHINSRMSP